MNYSLNEELMSINENGGKNRCNRTAVSRNDELRRLVDRPRDSLFGVLGGSSANR